MNLLTRRLLKVLDHPLIKNQPVARHLWPNQKKGDAQLSNKKRGTDGRSFSPDEVETATRYLRGELAALLALLNLPPDDQRDDDRPADPGVADEDEPGNR
jgi:hypothetical protein